MAEYQSPMDQVGMNMYMNWIYIRMQQFVANVSPFGGKGIP